MSWSPKNAAEEDAYPYRRTLILASILLALVVFVLGSLLVKRM